MKNLKNILLIGAFCGLAMLTSCGDKSMEVLKNNKGTQTKIIQKGDTYWKYAGELRKKNSKLMELDKRDVWMYLRDYNDGKSLIAGEDAKLPVY